MSSDLIDTLTRQVTDAATRFSAHIVPARNPAAELARDLEREVFGVEFGNTAEVLAQEYGPFEPASVFVLIVDNERHCAAGTIRMITPSLVGSKTLADCESVWGIEPAAVLPPEAITGAWDMATVVAAPRYRGTGGGVVSAALYQCACATVAANSARWVTASLDVAVLELIQRGCGAPFEPVPGACAAPYLGSPATVPVFCDLRAYRERLARTDPALHQFMFNGSGLEHLVTPPADLRLRHLPTGTDHIRAA